MRLNSSLRSGQTKPWVIICVIAAALLGGAVAANAEKGLPIAFQFTQGGIAHFERLVDDHHVCGTGFSPVFGHYTVTIKMLGPTKGIVAYQFGAGEDADLLYGEVDLRPTAKSGLYRMTVVFTKGTGQFLNVSGTASGVMQFPKVWARVKAYTLTLDGSVSLVK
jgi:hypothetical protein